jgi:hypothetical protein
MGDGWEAQHARHATGREFARAMYVCMERVFELKKVGIIALHLKNIVWIIGEFE